MTGKQWRDIIYRFPEFQDGRITLREGYSPEHPLKLNYNIHQDRVEFLSERGDTNVFNNSVQIKSITMGTQVFYNDYPSGYIEKVNQTFVALGAKHHLKMMFESNNGELFSAMDWNLPTTRLDRLYVRQDEYFFIDEHEMTNRATLPAILKIYATHKHEIKKYVKKNDIDFKKKEDLIRLLEFCQLLTSRQPVVDSPKNS